jgi:uncharacterized protein (DUF427 family)
MSLTVGTGPFGHRPAGHFDFEPPETVTYVEPFRRRVRAVKDGETVVDSDRVVLVWRTGRLPRYAFPADDVRIASDPEPAADGYVTVAWYAVDRWIEEDDEVVVHPRDPYHRIDVLESSRRVRVLVQDAVVAESSRPRILFETALPPRYYLVRDDVRMDLLSDRDLTTGCAYKGFARYFDAAGAAAIAWTYPEPRRDGELVRDRIAFFQERPELVLEVDGVVQERPRTQWADPGWFERR